MQKPNPLMQKLEYIAKKNMENLLKMLDPKKMHLRVFKYCLRCWANPFASCESHIPQSFKN